MSVLKEGDVVISPVSHEYLTKGKEYVVIKIEDISENNALFQILDDVDYAIGCALLESIHLGGLDWIVKE